MQMVSEEVAFKKLGLAFVVGSVTLMASLIITKLADSDPWGGMQVDQATGTSLLLGCLAAAPLALLKQQAWITHKQHPVVQDYHKARGEEVQPWLSNMNKLEMSLLCALEAIPVVFLLLPAAHAIIGDSADIISHLNDPATTDNAMRSLESLGVRGDVSEAPKPLPRSPEDIFNIRLWGLVLTSILAGLGKLGENVVDGEVERVLDEACDNADKYYRVTSTSQSGQEQEAKRASEAFKLVCEAYVDVKTESALVAGLFTGLETAYITAVWFMTGNLAAALSAFYLISLVDYQNYHELATNKGQAFSKRTGNKV